MDMGTDGLDAEIGMTIYLAVDSSLSMTVGEEPGRFQYATQLAAKTAEHLFDRLFNRKIALVQFSHNSSVLASNIKSAAEVTEALSNIKVTGSSDLLSLFSLMKREKAGKSSVLVIIADASSFTTEEITYAHLPECPIVVACVIDEFKADTGQIARFVFLSSQVDGVSMASLMKKGIFERYKPFFKSDFENVENFAAALSEAVIPCSEFILRCGMLIAPVQIVPAAYDCMWEETIEIIGFSKASNLGNAPATDLHFLKLGDETKDGEDASAKGFLSLIYHSLMSEEMVAMCRLTTTEYGVISAVKNEGKEDCLVIYSLPSESGCLHWMKDLDKLVSKPLSNAEDFKLCLPSDGLSKPSYSAQRTIWDEAFGIQSDIQKILRLLKKIPDRTPAFYAELNRVHAYACAIGAEDVHNKLIDLIEAETNNQSPLIKKHSNYVCAKLRHMRVNDSSEIIPLP